MNGRRSGCGALYQPIAFHSREHGGDGRLGHEFVGRVRNLADAVQGHAIGDLVLVSFQPSCGECVQCGRGHGASCSSVPPTSMYGVGAVAGDWGGAFADLIRVPYATTNMIGSGNVTPAQATSASDNLADAYRTAAETTNRL